MSLRPYQNDVIVRLRQAYAEGYKAPCIVAPCGAGKSVMVADVAKRTTMKGNRVLFLVHRQELCQQIDETFRGWGVDMRLCQIGMVQTIVRRLPKIKEPVLIITDENHHSMACSYKRIYEYFPNARRVGVTATPVRLNGSGLGDVNDLLIESVSTKWLIQNQYLAPFTYYSPSVADLTGLHSSRGEYVTKEIEERMNKQSIHGDVIRYYNKLAADKQAICYCTSVAHSQAVAAQFCAAGIWAEHIDGSTPKKERQHIIQDFRAGRVQMLCNVDLISEGFDVPDCGAAILLRPTKSLTLYIQQSMRCMRYKEGKNAVIIDHVGNYARFGLPDLEREWSLDSKPKKGRRKEENHIKIRQCPKCFFTHDYGDSCPLCGYVYPVKDRTLEEIKETKLERIEGIVLDYTTPKDCTTMAELQAYAKQHHYKPGWVWYQAKERGIIA